MKLNKTSVGRGLAPLLAGVALAAASPASAALTVLDFEELGVAGAYYPDHTEQPFSTKGYVFGGGTEVWDVSAGSPLSSYNGPAHSGSYVAATAYSKPITMTRQDGGTFNLVDFYVASLRSTGSNTTIEAYLGGALVGSLLYSWDAKGFAHVETNFTNIDKVVFNVGDEILIDDVGVSQGLSAVPEPSAWATVITGFSLLGGVLRRRARAQQNPLTTSRTALP